MEFMLFKIHSLQETFCLFKLLTSTKVSEDKENNYLGPQIGKTYLNYCVPVLFRVSRRAKHENILLDVVKWVVQLNNCKHDIRNSERSFPCSFRRIRTRDSQSTRERGLCYNF